jgi:glycosyltransferase involved in cell wall biosynthesis
MNIPLTTLSVIIPCYNEGEELISCVNSVLCQSILPKEIIIVDDASTNSVTLRILKEIEKNSIVKVIYNKENQGPGIARNIGIKECISEWILLLDSDDILLNEVIENVVSAINENPASDFFFWNYVLNEVENNEQKIISTKEICKDGSALLDPYKLARNFIIHGCSPFKKQLWVSLGGYDPLLSKGGVEDIDFWRRAVFDGAIGNHIDKILYQWNRKTTGNNSNIDEFKYLIHRTKMLPYYDKYNPEQAAVIRPYIYRYYSSRLMAKELNVFLATQNGHFGLVDIIKAKLIYIKPLYKIMRFLKNNLK